MLSLREWDDFANFNIICHFVLALEDPWKWLTGNLLVTCDNDEYDRSAKSLE